LYLLVFTAYILIIFFHKLLYSSAASVSNKFSSVQYTQARRTQLCTACLRHSRTAHITIIL